MRSKRALTALKGRIDDRAKCHRLIVLSVGGVDDVRRNSDRWQLMDARACVVKFAGDGVFSESVKRFHRERGSHTRTLGSEKHRGRFADAIAPEVAAYIAERESAYFATASAASRPHL